MSHTVTVTRTTTTSSTSAILLNIGYFKKPPGILKLLHVILGIITVGILGHYFQSAYYTAELYFLLVATTCLITSFLLLLSCFISIATATILPKTVFELLFHGVATILLLIGAAVTLARIHERNSRLVYNYKPSLVAGILGLINSILYGVAAFFSYRHYKTG